MTTAVRRRVVRATGLTALTGGMFMGTLETAHFDFEAFELTEERVRKVLERAWRTHQQQTGATMPWAEVAGDVQVRFVKVGVAYRDRSEVE